jgi:hypothetical protein
MADRVRDSGKFLYRGAAVSAAVFVLFSATSYLYNANNGEPVLPLAPLLLAGAVWLVGYFCRYALSEH